MVSYQNLAFYFFLPRVVAYVQGFIYSLTYRAGDPKPQPHTPRYITHQRRIHISLLVISFLFSVYQTYWDLTQAPTLYASLGVPIDVSDRALASHFRRLTASLHPDKIANPTARANAEQQYVIMKEHRDVLADPVRKYAYDRLGSSMLKLDGKNFRKMGDFVKAGLTSALTSHLGGLAVLALAQYVGIAPTRQRFWQYLAFLAVFAVNVHVITHAAPPAVMDYFNTALRHVGVAPLLPFEWLKILGQATVSLFIALNQAGSIPPPPGQRPKTLAPADATAHNHQQIRQMMGLLNGTNLNVLQLLEMDAAPFSGDEKTKKELQSRMEDWVVQNQIRNDERVRNAIGEQRIKRRTGVPAGARGTR